jgi:hypothetical protein
MIDVEQPRPAYERALKLIDALEKDAGPNATLHGLIKAWIIATANDIDSKAERHRSNGTD